VSIADISSIARLTNLREQARAAIRTSIVTGELKPDTLYTIGAFAERLGVSATPVRDALGDLAQTGLVKIKRNRGFVVPDVTEHDLDEIFQIRLMLEPSALTQVVGKLTAADFAECQELVDRGKKAAAERDLGVFLQADRDFHMRLLAPLGNRRLIDILGQLRDHTRLYGLRAMAASGVLGSSAEEHQDLLKTLESGDVEAVCQSITRHLKHTRGAWAGRVEDPA
jgi:DNA-binding GntR family transcriptional regulator